MTNRRWKSGHLIHFAASVAIISGCEQRSPPDLPESATTLIADSVLTPEGWQNIRIGMSRAALVAVAGEDANPDAVGGPNPAICDEFHPINSPTALLVMVRSGHLSRIAISEGSRIITDRGIAVGDSVAAVREAYGDDAIASPHAFHAAPAEYLTIWETRPPSALARGITYEIDGTQHVARILAGDASIEYREGCV
jgi:hypothetical protein